MTVSEIIDELAPRYGLDPVAVKVVALGEGGLKWGAVGDSGTSFGPFQMHIGGAIPRQYANPTDAAKFANSYAGIDYAMRKMAEEGASGLTGWAAIDRIVGRQDEKGVYLYGFERPANPKASIAKAWSRYQSWTGGGAMPETTSRPAADSGYVFPVAGKVSFSNDWGNPRSGGRTHQGTDIFAPKGTPVVAVEDGTVNTGSNTLGGTTIWLNSRFYYAHLSGYAPGIRNGSQVTAGQVIGYVGNTGDARSTPPHLHFGYDPNGTHGASWENPYGLLTGNVVDPGDPSLVDPADGTNPSLYGGPAATGAEAPDVRQDWMFGDQPQAPIVIPEPNVPEALPVGARPVTDYGRGRRDYGQVWQMIAGDEWASPESQRYAGQ